MNHPIILRRLAGSFALLVLDKTLIARPLGNINTCLAFRTHQSTPPSHGCQTPASIIQWSPSIRRWCCFRASHQSMICVDNPWLRRRRRRRRRRRTHDREVHVLAGLLCICVRVLDGSDVCESTYTDVQFALATIARRRARHWLCYTLFTHKSPHTTHGQRPKRADTLWTLATSMRMHGPREHVSINV